MSLRPPATTTAAMLPEIERDTLGTVIAVTGKTCRVQLAGGDVVSGIDASGVAVGQTLRLRYAGGTYTVQGGAGSGSSSGGGASAGGSGGIAGAPSPHDLLGVHHTLPTLAANLFLASPVSASGLPAFRAIVPADLPGQFAGFANPSAQIGLTAINGSATTAMRSDAAPAINQSIAPTWLGVHTFNTGVKLTSTQVAEFGAGVAGKQTDAGKVGYQAFSTALDIVGAGTTSGQRTIKLWDNSWIAGYIGSETYTSQTTGWRIDSAGGADFRYVFVDEMHAKSFIADLEQALAGGQIISKSVAMMGKVFTAPAAGGATTLWVRDLPSAPNMAAFQSGDIVRVRTFSRSAGSLSITDCWGVVTSYADGTGTDEGLQSWTFTRSSAPNAGAMVAGATVPVDAIVLDYGTSGNGIWETNAIDGAYAANSPYTQAVQWTGHPETGSVVRYRAGKLDGWGSGYAGTNTFGFVAGNAAGTWIATEATNGFRIMYGANPVAQVDTTGAFLFRGAPSASVNVGALRWNPFTYVFEGGYYAPAAGPSYGAYTQQWKTDANTGEIVAGAGKVRIGLGGIVAVSQSGLSNDSAYRFTSAHASDRFGLYSFSDIGYTSLWLNNTQNTSSYTAYIDITASGAYFGQVSIAAKTISGVSNSIVLSSASNFFGAPNGRNYFKDVELSTGNGLRVGGVWSMYGIYAESGYCAVGGASGVNLQNGALTSNGSTVYVRDSLGIGTTPPDTNYHRVSVYGGFNATSAWAGYYMESRDNSSQTWCMYGDSSNFRIWGSANGDLVRIDTSGNASKLSAGTAWSSFSDARVKNISGEYTGGLAEVLRLRPIVYDYNGEAGTIPNGRNNVGIIAQEIREVLPDTIVEDANTGMLMFDSTELTWALVNAIKDLSQKVATLEAIYGTRY